MRGGQRNTPAAKNISTGFPESMLIEDLIDTNGEILQLAAVVELPEGHELQRQARTVQ